MGVWDEVLSENASDQAAMVQQAKAAIRAADNDGALYKSPATGNEIWPDGTAYVVVTPTDVCVVWTPDWNDAKREADKVWETYA